jgi:putative membrane protein
MTVVGLLLVALAAAIHGYVFVLESLTWTSPRTRATFGVRSDAEVEATRLLAFNQGFYNLFLAVGVAIGLALEATGQADAGRVLVLFACGSMVAAGLVLVLHDSRFVRAGALQVVPPLVAILAIAFLG